MKYLNLAKQKLNSLATNDNLRTLRPFSHDAVFIKNNGKSYINLASNDYLGVSAEFKEQGAHPSFEGFRAFLDSLNENIRFSASSSRLLSGDFMVFSYLENLIANAYNQHITDNESLKECLLFNSGYSANISLIESLSKLGNVLFLLDEFSHASIFDGIKLSGARFRRFKHNDMQELQNLLDINHKDYDVLIIVSEGLFSMEGDFLHQHIFTLKNSYDNVLLYIDEAHSIGAFGKDGLGIVSKYEKIKEVDFLLLTFGKAIGSIGACVVCAKQMRSYFINFARSLIYSTALPPINIAFSAYIFSLLKDFEDKRLYIDSLSKQMRVHLSDIFGQERILGEAHIISLLIGENQKALQLSEFLESKGIFAPCIRYPTVPKGTARIRLSLNGALKEQHKDMVLNVFNDAKGKV